MKISKYLSSIILIVLTTILILFSVFTSSTSSANNHYLLNDNWDIVYNGELIQKASLDSIMFDSIAKGDNITLTARIPRTNISAAELDFLTVHTIFEVYVDNQLIYEYGQEQLQKYNLVGYGIHRIDLPADYQNKELKIQMSVVEDNSFTGINTPDICNVKYSIKDYLFKRKIPLVVNIFIVTFSIILLIISMVSICVKRNMYEVIHIGLFALSIGLWSLCNYDLMFIWTENIAIKSLIEYISLYSAPLFFLIYFVDDFKRTNNRIVFILFRVTEITQISFIVFSIIGNMLRLTSYPSLLGYQHIIMGISAIEILFILFYKIRHHYSDSGLVVGTSIMIVLMLFDMVKFNLQKFGFLFVDRTFYGLSSIGTLIMIVTLLMDYVLKIINAMREGAQNELIAQMAYIDSMTGLANRRKCELVYENINNENLNYIIFSFDLNRLKEINDTKGHAEGDDYIIAFSKALKDAFDEDSTIARVGGDEFLIILIRTYINEDLIKFHIHKLVDLIANINKEHVDWQMSTAYGYASSLDNPENIQAALRLADKRMYENKQQFHHN